MFDSSKYKSYRYHSSMLYIDESSTIADVRAACPLFFENSHKGEKRTMYRGHLIIKFHEKYSTWSADRIVIYAWDVRTKDTHSIDVDVKPCDIREAKRIINEKLDTPEPNPLRYSVAVETMNVPVKVAVVVFRDADGNATNIDIDKWLLVGNTEATDRKPIDLASNLYSYVSHQVHQSLVNTK